MENAERAHKNFPKSGRGLSHVTPKNVWHMIEHISKTIWARDFKFGRRLVWRMTSRRTKISPKSGRGLGHVTPTIFVSTIGYPSDSLASCYVSQSSSKTLATVQ